MQLQLFQHYFSCQAESCKTDSVFGGVSVHSQYTGHEGPSYDQGHPAEPEWPLRVVHRQRELLFSVPWELDHWRSPDLRCSQPALQDDDSGP
ncbi:hypothetical protein GE061_004897 [Apolygus lucorum]|uniref:Uncharacterized protein n=1 Tax=Apolygus lucorum TaxID=248454 RepID=A0A8S9WW50_APOLU|nr:hypothetical protein GE061_004897 [Apolygus lucorum]